MTRIEAVAFIERWHHIVVSRLCAYRECTRKADAHSIMCSAHRTAGGRLNSWKHQNRDRYRAALKALGD